MTLNNQRIILYYIVFDNFGENIKDVKFEGSIIGNAEHGSHELKKQIMKNCTFFRSPKIIPYGKLIAPNSKYLDKDGTLNLGFKVTLKVDSETGTDESQNLAEDYKKMLTNAEDYHADATIICKDGRIRAHKNILLARSEYFNAMLSTKMKEGLSGTVEVLHMEMSVCHVILEYIYSGKVEQDKMNVEVLAEAEKMGLLNLKKQCSTKLINNLNTSNCVEMIEAGDLHKDQELKIKAKKFIIENYQDLSHESKAGVNILDYF